ncbi:MAG: ATP synthase F1 subunit epsilon [Bacteroidales bacterium]|jgi:F-type H+-transporting ATPase subunit epsilon|nr:ATP synthase F1 subunit epsilon [Bacteroidales bacterium]
MKLEIRTPDKSVFSGEVTLVQMPGIDGLFEILDHHAPLVAALQKGRIKIEDASKQQQFFDINGGVAEVLDGNVLVLAE